MPEDVVLSRPAGITGQQFVVGQQHRNEVMLGVSIAVIGTALGFAFLSPYHIQLQQSFPSTVSALRNIRPFAVAFCILSLAYSVVVLLSRDSRRKRYLTVFATLVIALTFLNYWNFATASSGKTEDWNLLAHVAYLGDRFFIDRSVTNLGYFFFPGFHLVVHSLGLISSADFMTLRLILLPYLSLLLVLSVFLLSSSVTKGSVGTAGSVLLFVVGNTILARGQFLFPANLGVTLLGTLLAFSIRLKGNGPDRFVLLILFFALVISHAPSSLAFLLATVGGFVVNQFHSFRLGTSVSRKPPVRLVSWAIAISWAIYFALPVVIVLTGEFKQAFNLDPFRWILLTGTLNLGSGVPRWASLTQMIAMLLAYVPGGLLLAFWLVARAPMPVSRALLCGGLAGIVFMSVLGILGGRSFDFVWLFYYGAFFTAPAIFHGFGQLKPVLRERVAGVVVVFLSALLFPAFLVSNGRIARDAVYPNEVAATTFLKTMSRTEGRASIFLAGVGLGATPRIALPHAVYLDPPEAFSLVGPEDFFARMDGLIRTFIDADSKSGIWVESARVRVEYGTLLGIPLNGAMWWRLEGRLAPAQLVYSNGEVGLHTR